MLTEAINPDEIKTVDDIVVDKFYGLQFLERKGWVQRKLERKNKSEALGAIPEYIIKWHHPDNISKKLVNSNLHTKGAVPEPLKKTVFMYHLNCKLPVPQDEIKTYLEWAVAELSQNAYMYFFPKVRNGRSIEKKNFKGRYNIELRTEINKRGDCVITISNSLTWEDYNNNIIGDIEEEIYKGLNNNDDSTRIWKTGEYKKLVNKLDYGGLGCDGTVKAVKKLNASISVKGYKVDDPFISFEITIPKTMFGKNPTRKIYRPRLETA